MFDNFFEYIGIFVVFCLFLQFFYVPIIKILSKPFRKSLLQRYGKDSWAVVTGASDGLGKGFCEELAKEGFNIVLMARNKEKMQIVSKELQQINPNIQTQIIVIDFKEANKPEIFQEPFTQLQKLDVSILVNNVGVDLLGHYDKLLEQQELELIILNIYPLVRLTKALLPSFIKRKKRSGIINVGSTCGLRPMPYFTVYSSTKAFNNFFSQALSIEYPGVDILSLQPLYISTPLTHHKALGPDTVSPRECARGTLDDLGFTRRTFGHWKHKILANLLTFVPHWLFSRFAYDLGIKQEMERRESFKKRAY